MGPPFRTIHQDDSLLVVDKAPGLVAVAPKHKNVPITLLDSARKFVGRKVRLFVIDRVDADGSGLVVMAKGDDAFDRLKVNFKGGKVHRVMTAVVDIRGRKLEPGHVETIRRPIDDPERGNVRVLDEREFTGQMGGDSSTRSAITHIKVQEVGRGRALVQVRLETARRDQARAHLAAAGMPIVGDGWYGNQRGERLALHMSELGFIHPGTGQRVRYTAPNPPEFYELIGKPVPEHARPKPPEASKRDSSWENVAEWYDDLIEERRSDHYDEVILPRTIELLDLAPGLRVLDLACGQGVLSRLIAEKGADVVGVDSAESLIASAKDRSPEHLRYEVGDARNLTDLELGVFDKIACVMALMNIDELTPVLRTCAGLLKPGGALVGVVLHPVFRSPKTTSWGWLEQNRTKLQFRRIDAYLSSRSSEIIMNPAEAAAGGEKVTTSTHHRPIEGYVRALADAGLMIDRLDEWASTRTSEPGPRSDAENLARREIPLFLAFRAIKTAQ